MDVAIQEVKDGDGNFRYHDIYFVNGRLAVVDGIKEIKNRIICNLSVYLGEMYTNTSFGTDYFNNVLGRDITDPTVIDELKSQILQTRGVTGLKTFDLVEVEGSRDAKLTAQIVTTQGQIDLTTPIPT